jgi:Flp pilus assembly protein TadD
MLSQPARLIGVGLSLFLLAACQTSTGSTSLSDTPVTDANLEPTIRKAAADAEASYNYAEAAQHYSSLLEKHPADMDLVLAVARNLRYSGSSQQAIDVVSRRIAKVGPKEPLLIELGKDYLAADQLNLSISTLQQAREIDPHNWQILSALGVAQDYQGNYKDAQATYQQGLKLSANNPVLLNNYALSLAQSGDLPTAIATLEAASGQTGATAQTRQNLALLLALKGDKDGASRLVRADLPPDMAQNNITYYEGMNSP